MAASPRKCTEVDAKIGERLRGLRQKTGMSQSDLGQCIGVSFQQIQKYEAGKNRVAVSTMLALTDHLGISAARFLRGIAT
jgi:transcriptional regulator with XRE-family HTH domain